MPLLPTLAVALSSVVACASTSGPKDAGDGEQAAAAAEPAPTPATLSAGDRIAKPKPKADPRAIFGKAAPAPEDGQAVALFAAGCFWCIEKPFDAVPGVLATTSGYTDGPEVAPTYQAVSRKLTGHTEAIRVLYDPTRVTYAELLDVFWHNIDPTQADAQFCDKGPQYRAGIYTSDPAERALAEATKAEVARRLSADVVTEIDAAGPFWPAEDYHQDFYSKEPAHYERYRLGCGRDARLKELWGQAAVTGAGAGWIEAAAEAAGVALPGAGEEAGALEAGDASGDAAGDAADLPGPPVEMVVTRDGQQVMAMELLEAAG